MKCQMIIVKEGDKTSIEEFNNFTKDKCIVEVETISRANAQNKTMVVYWN